MSTTLKKGAVKFVNAQKSLFYPTLKKRVDTYFSKQQISRYGNSALVIKTMLLLSAYILPFAILVYYHPGWVISLLLWSVMGLAVAGLGMSVMHDANHGAYSSNKVVNWLMAHVLNLIGGSTMNWKLQHNILHHTYTNITHLDDDIASKPALRLSPHVASNRWHRYQWFHAFFLYGLTTLYWVTVKDFIQLNRYRKNKVSTLSAKAYPWTIAQIIVEKLIYFAVFFVVPIGFFHFTFPEVFAGFILMHFIAGLILTVVFQLAHSLEGTTHPLPDSRGIIDNDWAIHQMNTTMNFAPSNKLLSWFVGGLNFQIEHHLFPRIAHIHYPALAPIVKETANEFNIPYLQHDTFTDALMAHIVFLKKLGRLPDIEDAIG